MTPEFVMVPMKRGTRDRLREEKKKKCTTYDHLVNLLLDCTATTFIRAPTLREEK